MTQGSLFTLIFGLFFTWRAPPLGGSRPKTLAPKASRKRFKKPISFFPCLYENGRSCMQLRFSNGKKSQSSDSLIQQNKQQALQMSLRF